jgi:ADP-ribose pyrophosphatase YjhB (NUDIX family)
MPNRCIMVFLYHRVNSQPMYLLLKRNLELGGYWQPVTGFIEPPETNREAALRELGEETGVKNYKRVIDPKHSFHINMNGLQCSVTVLAVEVSSQPQVRLSYEHTDHSWLNYTDARERLFWENNRETLDKLHRQLQHERRAY